MPAKIANPKKIHAKSAAHTVTPHGPSAYKVISGTSGSAYFVCLLPAGGATCNCRWGQYRPWADARSGCSHVQAVVEFVESQKARTTSAWGSREEAARQHRPMVGIGDGVIMTSRKA
jgi:hypothetical protein